MSRRTVVVLGLLSTFGPLSLDLYLPALPSLAAELDASPSSAQLSITACLIGLAVGQLVAGPMSDRYGRRRPLLIGLVIGRWPVTCSLGVTCSSCLRGSCSSPGSRRSSRRCSGVS